MALGESDPGRSSDQLPEDAPSTVARDGTEDEAGEGAARSAARRQARRANRSGHDPGDPRDRRDASHVAEPRAGDAGSR